MRDIRKLEAPTKLRIGKSLLRLREEPLKYSEKISDRKLVRIVFVLVTIE